MVRNVLICTVLLLGIDGTARATQLFTVDSALDEPDIDVGDGICRSAGGACTLRAAVMEANAQSASSVVVNLPSRTYFVTQPIDNLHPGVGGSFVLSASSFGSTTVSIVGTDAAQTIIDGSLIDRLFTIEGARNVTFANLTIRNGFATATQGGGIWNNGTLTLDHVVVTKCRAVEGGGIFNGSSGTLSIVDSSIADNVANFGGGLLSAGTIDISTSTFAANAAAEGGGIYAEGNAYLTNATIAGNHATDNGGGIVSDLAANAVISIYNTTIAYNYADSDADNAGSGGGVYVHSGNLFNLFNTLVAGNYHINPAFADDCYGSVHTHAYNRFGNLSQCVITPVSGAYALLNSLDDLGPLQDNGGATPTVALLAGSNAINAAAPICVDAFSKPISKDQRGFPRNVGNCDIGAFEYGSIDPNDTIFADGFGG